MESFREFLAEMLVHNLSRNQNPEIVIAFRQHIWILPKKDYSSARKVWTEEETIRSILKDILKAHPQRKELGKPKIESLDDLLGWIRDYIPDAIVGWYDEAEKSLYLQDSAQPSPYTSPLVKKVAQTLKLRTVKYSATDPTEDERTKSVTRPQMKGNWPDIAFHGTSTAHIENILVQGLNPGESASNWEQIGIHHYDRIFLTVKFEEAQFHAVRTASGQGHKETAGLPIVVAVRIPDKNLIVPDYDIDAHAGRTSYGHERERKSYDALYSVSSSKASKHAGIFGYKGRIPANHIVYISVYSSVRKQWIVERNINRFKKLLRDMGTDYFYRRYGEEKYSDPNKNRYY